MIFKATTKHLNQINDVLAQLDDKTYSQKLDILSDSSIGMHIRHILEFYSCLMESCECKEVNYDLRKRDLQLETSVAEAQKTVTQILNYLMVNQQDYELKLIANYGDLEESMLVDLPSSYFRELLYNIEHTVHHLALIKIGLRSLSHKINLSDEIGVASSTLRNKKICAQ